MIGIDWGMTSFRAFRLSAGGAIRDRRTSPRGVARIQDRRFGDTLREEIGPWLAGGEQHVLISGPVAGREGWVAVPYLPCPAGPSEIAAALTSIGFEWADVRFLPRLSSTDPDGVPEMTRGEEGLFAAALAFVGENGLACLPGTNSRWVRIADRRIAGFTTHLTGEAFAALRPPALASRMMREPIVTDVAAFDAGLARAAQGGGLLHHLSGARALATTGAQGEEASLSYLFGLLVGHEIRAALAGHHGAGPVHVIGPPDLAALYARAIEAVGGMAECLDGEAVARGLALIGTAAGLK
jgi:2-dehydro-3-deoxygalactonokinase